MSSPPSPPLPHRRYGGISAQDRLAQRRERLLEAAFDVFGRQGHAGATMRLVCANARLTERYFYECFANMDELFRTVHERLSTELVGQIAATAVLEISADPMALVRDALKIFFEYIKADPRRARILLLDAMTLGQTNTGKANSRARWYADLIRQRLKARYEHLPPELDMELVASGYLGLVIHTAAVWAERGFDTPVEDMVAHTACAWAGLHQWLASAAQQAQETQTRTAALALTRPTAAS